MKVEDTQNQVNYYQCCELQYFNRVKDSFGTVIIKTLNKSEERVEWIVGDDGETLMCSYGKNGEICNVELPINTPFDITEDRVKLLLNYL